MAATEHCWPIPMKAIGAQNLLTMPGGVTNSGYLHKKGGTQLQLLKWPLRFVIIHKGCVYYFKTSTSASSQGAFSLNGYNRVMRAAEETTSNNVFPFKIVHISKKHRTWYFSASSEDERKKWMSSLRKEIDHYNEKKETVTDLSDTESDTDSFYGSVERPVSIAYNQSIMDSEGSLHGYDEDDDEDGGYEQPTIDDSGIPPPNYPPPPPPGPVSSQRISGVPSKPQPPLPPQKKPFSPMDHTMLRKETPVLPQTSVKEQPTVPHLKVSGSPPVLPPISYPRTSGAERTSWNPTASPKPVLTSQKAFSPSPKDLDNALKSMNMSSQGPPPLPPYKPKTIPKSILTEHAKETPAVKDNTKPGMFRPQVLPKPMPAHKAVDPVKKTTPDKPPVPQIQRSSPDGQSFRELPTEKPRTLPRGKLSLSHEEQKDSDGDYEKVCLPMSVYVNTTDSAEVERIMRASNAGRGPLDGLYCIRDSTRAGKVLVVWDESLAKLRNYRIFEKSCEVYLEENLMFADIGCLVEHYHTNILPSHNTLILKHPYGYSRPR